MLVFPRRTDVDVLCLAPAVGAWLLSILVIMGDSTLATSLPVTNIKGTLEFLAFLNFLL